MTSTEIGPKIWKGAGKTRETAEVFIAPHSFEFGGKLVLKGSTCRQFETGNFGWTQWANEFGARLARE